MVFGSKVSNLLLSWYYNEKVSIEDYEGIRNVILDVGELDALHDYIRSR
jgi:hypothetical protein